MSDAEKIKELNIQLKKCKHCGISKPNTGFQKAGGGRWLQPYCKPCDKIRKDKHRAANSNHYKELHSRRYLENRVLVSPEQKAKSRQSSNEKLILAGRKYAEENRISPGEKKRRKSECDKRYRENNKERILAKKKAYKESGRAAETAKSWQARMMGNIYFRLKKNLRGRIYVALKRGCKSDHTINLLGCSIEGFKEYIEQLFSEGMSWDNMGGWHLDHIKPCKLFDLTNEKEQRRCFGYKNIQPLWKLDNLIKGIKYE